MTFQVTGSPYSAPIPYGVTIHPFANITVVDTNKHPNISADVFAGGAGHWIDGTNLIGWNGTAHGTEYAISNVGAPGNPKNLPPITAAQMTTDLRSITYTSSEPDPASPWAHIEVNLTDGSATTGTGFEANNVSQVVTMQQNATLITAPDPAVQAIILANPTKYNLLDNQTSPTILTGKTGYDFGRPDLYETPGGFSDSIVYMTTGDTVNLGNGVGNTIYMGSGNETVNDANISYPDDTIYAGTGVSTINTVADSSSAFGNLVTINGSSGTTHVNTAWHNFGFGSSTMTFIGGSGVATVWNANVAYGAKGGSHLFGADGAQLYSGGGSGQTFFGLTNLQDSITVESFKSGKDMIDLPGMSAAGVVNVLKTQTYAGGVDTLHTYGGDPTQGLISINIDRLITARDISLV